MDIDDIDSLLDGAVGSQDTMPVCLRGDLLDEYTRAVAALNAARDQAGDSLDGGGDTPRLAQQVEQLRAQVKAATVPVVLRALPDPDWAPLLAEHPPQEGSDLDKLRGYGDTFLPALVRACIHSPSMVDDQRWVKFRRALSNATWSELTDRAWNINRKTVDVPF